MMFFLSFALLMEKGWKNISEKKSNDAIKDLTSYFSFPDLLERTLLTNDQMAIEQQSLCMWANSAAS